jgi:Spy/CpxP family protein refolding chaperone
MERNQWKAFLLAVLLFGFGAAVGVLGQRYYSAQTVNANTAPDSHRQAYIGEMQKRLHLTAAQTTQLETIMDDTKARYKALRESYRPETLKIKQEHVERVKSILTAEQIPTYEKIVAEHEQNSRAQEERDRKAEQERRARQAGQ